MTSKNIDYASLKGLPVGSACINKIIEQNLYYVDKTPYIKKIFQTVDADVLLIARPRRFGKSLAMDTFYKFLNINPENPEDTSFQDKIFKDMKIYEDKEFCQEFMGKYPVISISFKDVDENNFKHARDKVASCISTFALTLKYLAKSPKFDKNEIKNFGILTDLSKLKKDEYQVYLSDSLKTLSNMLYRYYGKPVIILIDEYDVPIAKAYEGGYYNEMVKLIKGMLSASLKDNPALFKGILTGCLRVSKESIFTGFNNFKVNSISNDRGQLAECMGFTKDEVKTLLSYYGLTEYESAVKEWYDGYRIFKSEIFCPWDVINYCSDAKSDLEQGNDVLAPQSYWSATGANNVIAQFMPYLDEHEAERMQTLLDGGEIDIIVNEQVNYNDIGRSHKVNDFWTLLLYTGYLTSVKNEELDAQSTACTVRIPNKELKKAFKDCIVEYYNSIPVKESSGQFLKALLRGDAINAETMLRDKLQVFVSIRDFNTKATPENFYHGFLNGIFSSQAVNSSNFKSNAEAGNGYADIMYCSDNPRVGIILELKSTKSGEKLISTAQDALKQIETKKYAMTFALRHIHKVYCYGIAFCRKDCYMQCETKEL